jgi:hypothetical protein
MKELQSQLKSYLSHPFAWIIGGVICCLLSLGYYLHAQYRLHQLAETGLLLKKRKEWTAQKEELEKKLLQQLRVADRDYIENELETLTFLTPEIKRLKASLHSNPAQAALKERLQFLESDQNRLHFLEQNFQRTDRFQQSEVLQDHPVEMNRDDLKNLLTKIENQEIGPFLLIKKFELSKKQDETYLIQLELTKSEMIHE